MMQLIFGFVRRKTRTALLHISHLHLSNLPTPPPTPPPLHLVVFHCHFLLAGDLGLLRDSSVTPQRLLSDSPETPAVKGKPRTQ